MRGLEHSFYPSVASWLQSGKACERTSNACDLAHTSLLNADVVGWKAGEALPTYACELKPYPLPVGAGGYGSIGQALALQRFVPLVYVACVASDAAPPDGVPDLSWKHVLGKSSVRSLASALEIRLLPSFDGYLQATQQIFRALFQHTGLGFIVVHDMGSRREVVEVEKPRGRTEAA